MSSYLIKRIFLALFTLFVIMLVSYTLVRIAPGDPTKSSMFGAGAESTNLSSDKTELVQNRSMRKELHLDEPILIGFAYWFKDVIFYGNLGNSVAVDKGIPVSDLIIERLPVTLKLNILSILIIYLLAIPLGIHSAVTKNKLFDKTTTFILFFLYSLPSFWIALILQATLGYGGKYPILPIKDLVANDNYAMSTFEYLWNTILHYILPVICLSYAGFAGLSRYAKAGMREVIKQDYIRTARAKGLSEFTIIFKHALRNALIILITLFAGLLPGLISGSIIIEHIFNIPGMGSLSIMALTSRDIPLMMALFGFGGGLTLLGIFFADIMYVIVDPRITFKNKN